MNFFVCGLPRSRTAWLANFLTYDKRFCFHEGLYGCNSIDQYRQKLGDNKGDSSTALMLLDINRLFPDAPVVIIQSDPARAIDYVYKVYGQYCPESIYDLQAKMDLIKGLRINMDDIDKKLPIIWDYLIGTEFDERRGQLLSGFNVQMNKPYSLDDKLIRPLSTILKKVN